MLALKPVSYAMLNETGEGGIKMSILIGLASLCMMCMFVVIFASFPISEYTKKKRTTLNAVGDNRDHYGFLFIVYDESTNTPKI